jgi:hypothetical protein
VKESRCERSLENHAHPDVAGHAVLMASAANLSGRFSCRTDTVLFAFPFDVKSSCASMSSSHLMRMLRCGVAVRTVIFTGSHKRRVRAFANAVKSASTGTLNVRLLLVSYLPPRRCPSRANRGSARSLR